jgi:hypothetical protein
MGSAGYGKYLYKGPVLRIYTTQSGSGSRLLVNPSKLQMTENWREKKNGENYGSKVAI